MADLDAVLECAKLFAIPALPPRVAECVASVGLRSPAAIMAADAAHLAATLSDRLQQEIGLEDVRHWQDSIRAAVAVPLPAYRDGRVDRSEMTARS